MAEKGAPDPDLLAHPGRPRGRDEIDPELLVIPRARARVGWLLALSVVVFCAYFLVRLWGDLMFSLQGDEPERLADPTAAFTADVNSYVEVRAVPDRATLLRVFASDAGDGHRLSPVLGSGEKVWLLFAGYHWSDEPAYDEVVRGRVARLGDLPFYDDLVERLESMPPVPRGVAPDLLEKAMAGDVVRDVAGDPVRLTPDMPVRIAQRVAGTAHVTAFRTDTLVDELTWRAALEKAGVVAPGARLVSSGADVWTFEAAAPEGAAAVAARLVEQKLMAARAEVVDHQHEATWQDLSVARQPAHSLAIKAEDGVTLVPWAEITSVLVAAPRHAPADSRVIITTERPGHFWHVLPLVILFALFALLFGWALWRALRPQKAAPAGEAAAA